MGPPLRQAVRKAVISGSHLYTGSFNYTPVLQPYPSDKACCKGFRKYWR
jgi:hypothetical protein